VLTQKYGWQMRAGLLLSRLSGRYPQRGIIEIRLTPRAQEAQARAQRAETEIERLRRENAELRRRMGQD